MKTESHKVTVTVRLKADAKDNAVRLFGAEDQSSPEAKKGSSAINLSGSSYAAWLRAWGGNV